MRSAIDNDNYTLIPRRKNLNTLARLGIMLPDALDEIYALTSLDYFSGPDIDRDIPCSDKLWTFKKYIYGENIYIKLKVEYQENKQVKIISFHIDNI